MHVREIRCTLTLGDGSTVEALLTAEGVQRWGADRARLAATVVITEAMRDAAADAGAFGEA